MKSYIESPESAPEFEAIRERSEFETQQAITAAQEGLGLRGILGGTVGEFSERALAERETGLATLLANIQREARTGLAGLQIPELPPVTAFPLEDPSSLMYTAPNYAMTQSAFGSYLSSLQSPTAGLRETLMGAYGLAGGAGELLGYTGGFGERSTLSPGFGGGTTQYALGQRGAGQQGYGTSLFSPMQRLWMLGAPVSQ